MIPTTPAKTSLYDQDYQLWIAETLVQLRAQNFAALDLAHLIEEIEDLGNSDKRALRSYVRRLCEHLLKIQYWQSERERCFRGWDVEVTNFRLQIQDILTDSPSLKRYLQEYFAEEYEKGRILCLKASGLDASDIPAQPGFTLEQALDDDWLPWQPQ